MKTNLLMILAVALVFTSATFAQEDGERGNGCPGSTDMSKIDPMVRITSLPNDLDKKAIMTLLSQEVSKDTGLDINMVTYYWQTFDCIVCPGGEKAGVKEILFVDLYVPGFMTDPQIKAVMIAIADSLAKNTDYTKKDLFIHTHVAGKGRCFIAGDVVTDWSQVGGPADEEKK